MSDDNMAADEAQQIIDETVAKERALESASPRRARTSARLRPAQPEEVSDGHAS